jgi:hypothetical protein
MALILVTGAVIAGAAAPHDATKGPGPAPVGQTQHQLPPVSVHGSTTVIRPAVPTPPGTSGADLVAARNEFESFQVAVEGGDGRAGVRVALGDEGLTGPNGAHIGAGDVTVYREAPYHVTFASDAEGEPGDWYDALIPERDPYYGEDRSAFPYDIPAAGKLVSWVDVHVPDDTAAGTYEGHVVVTQDDGATTLAVVPVRVRVIDYTMPSTSTLRSLFLSTPEFDPGKTCEAFDGKACDPDADSDWLLPYLFSRAGLENRVTVADPVPVRTPDFADPEQRALFDRYASPLLDGSAGPPAQTTLMSPRLRGAKLTTMWAGLGEDCFGKCLDGWRGLMGDRAFRSRFIYYACDEPGADPAAWSDCAGRVDAVDGQAPNLITATLGDASAAGATDFTDVLVPNVIGLVPDGVADPRPDYADYVGSAPDRQFWLYTSCNSHGCGPDTPCAYPEDPMPDIGGWPDYVIDEPASQARAMGWVAFEYGATGELYYSVTWSLGTAWTDQCIFGGNGDGNLFYPGRPDGYPGAPDSAIGGTTDIPIESLRLKRIRDGREDYEYLHELEARGEGAEAHADVEELLGGPDVAVQGANFSQADLDQARCRLARLIDPGLRRCP